MKTEIETLRKEIKKTIGRVGSELQISIPDRLVLFTEIERDIKEFIRLLKDYCYTHNCAGCIVAMEKLAGDLK